MKVTVIRDTIFNREPVKAGSLVEMTKDQFVSLSGTGKFSVFNPEAATPEPKPKAKPKPKPKAKNLEKPTNRDDGPNTIR